jgi:hypothetical protein
MDDAAYKPFTKSIWRRHLDYNGVSLLLVDATLCLREKRWSVAMDQGFRRGFTAAEKTKLWDRWRRGESLKAIGRAFGKPPPAHIRALRFTLPAS